MPLLAQNPTDRVILGLMTFGKHRVYIRRTKL
jgi:hypothetical protein